MVDPKNKYNGELQSFWFCHVGKEYKPIVCFNGLWNSTCLTYKNNLQLSKWGDINISKPNLIGFSLQLDCSRRYSKIGLSSINFNVHFLSMTWELAIIILFYFFLRFNSKVDRGVQVGRVTVLWNRKDDRWRTKMTYDRWRTRMTYDRSPRMKFDPRRMAYDP